MELPSSPRKSPGGNDHKTYPEGPDDVTENSDDRATDGPLGLIASGRK